MHPNRNASFDQLPIVPESVLRKHRVLEKFDNRFRACARLLQAMWREQNGLPVGTFTPPNGAARRLGSRLGAGAADAGRNFLTPAVAYVARRELAYQETGAFIERNRLFSNLLSSMPLAFNLFAPLQLDKTFAKQVVRSLLPQLDVRTILYVWFEHSPGRRAGGLTGDRSAFDVAIVFERSDGKQGFIGIELKYSETLWEPSPANLNPRYDALTTQSGLFKEPMNAALRVNPMQQLFREHLLAQAALMRGDWSEAHFVLIAPRHNQLVQRGAQLYAAHLTAPSKKQVPFVNITLEQVVEAISWAGEADYAGALHDRYCNWLKIDEAVEAALSAKTKLWSFANGRQANTVPLLAEAA